MERSNFIQLLEDYKWKALQEHTKECRVQAACLVSDEFKAAILELETAAKAVYAGMGAVEKKFKEIAHDNALSERCGYFYHNKPTTAILDGVIDGLAEKIRSLDTARNKRGEISDKFDAAIKAAKASRSPARLKELADALGIETPEIKVDSSVKAQVDTEFVKEKIKSVLLLE